MNHCGLHTIQVQVVHDHLASPSYHQITLHPNCQLVSIRRCSVRLENSTIKDMYCVEEIVNHW